MLYHSTRDCALQANDVEAIISGLAPDGGLYVPENIPEFDWREWMALSSQEISAKLLSIFFPNLPEVSELVRRAYEGKFETQTLTPTVQVGELGVLELFRGPTSAFKDIALSVLPYLLVAAKNVAKEDAETLVLTATSGDTGKAAMEGFADVPGTQICVFYPDGGVSQIQRAQMVTQEGNNVHVYGIRGNFDDAQTGVKKIFAKAQNADVAKTQNNEENLPYKLSSANSINIGRLVPQIMYYFAAYRDLLKTGKIQSGQKVDFSVPTGNFGDILAGYFAKRLGLPVGKLVCASNSNNVLTDFLRTGVYDRRRELKKTISPSMDILISSNLERMLYFLTQDSQKVQKWMNDLSEVGKYELSAEQLADLQEHFWAGYCDDKQAQETILQVWEEEGYLCDPHTAAGWRVALDYLRESKQLNATQNDETNPAQNVMVVLSTASPYKFPRAVLEALGQKPAGDDFALLDQLYQLTGVPVPANLADLAGKPERHLAVIEKTQMQEAVFGLANF